MVLYDRPGDDISRSLVGYWKLDDLKLSGTTIAIDRSEFNDGIIDGPINTTGINGLNPDAMLFDGVNDRVVTTKSIFSDEGTINIWVKPNIPLTGDSFRIFDSDNFSTALVKLSDFNIFVFLLYGFSIGFEDIGLKQDVLNMITLTWRKNGTNINSKIYNNGILILESSNVFSIKNSGNFVIGNNDEFSEPFSGMLTKFRIYNRELTSNEINKLFRLKL